MTFSLMLCVLLGVAVFLKGRIRNVINRKFWSLDGVDGVGSGGENLIPGELPPGEELDMLLNTNCSERRMNALFAALSSAVGKDKVEIPAPCKKLRETIATIDVFQRMELDQVMQPILGTVMASANGAYRFKVIEYEGLTVYKDSVGNKNLVFNCYVYELLQQFMIRLRVDVVKYVDVKKRDEDMRGKENCANGTTPEFPYYVIGMPSRDQLLPLPTEIINTGGGGGADVLSDKGVNPVEISPILGIHVNSLEQFNSNLVLSYAGAERMAKLGGVTDNTNEFSGYNDKVVGGACGARVSGQQDKAEEYNKWPVLDDMPRGEGQWPCKSESLDWGRDGVPIEGLRQKIGDELKAVHDNSDDKYNVSCPGTRSSAQHEPLQAQHWPTLGGLPRNSGENWWLFDRMEGVPAFIGGTRG